MIQTPSFAVIGAVCGNALSLAVALPEIKSKGIETIFCAGDAIGFIPMTDECIALCKAYRVTRLLGPCEFALVNPEYDVLHSQKNRTIAYRVVRESLQPTSRNELLELKKEIHHLDKFVISDPRAGFKTVTADLVFLDAYLSGFANNAVAIMPCSRLPFRFSQKTGQAEIPFKTTPINLPDDIERYCIAFGSSGIPIRSTPRPGCSGDSLGTEHHFSYVIVEGSVATVSYFTCDCTPLESIMHERIHISDAGISLYRTYFGMHG